MVIGEQYYQNEMDIKNKTVAIDSRSNSKLVHGFVRQLVDQKTGYLLAKPPTISSDNKNFSKQLNNLLDKSFLRTFKNLGKDAINKGIGWLHIFINENGVLAFKRVPSTEVIPLWADTDHTQLDAVIRIYELSSFEGTEAKTITKVEYWDTTGIKYFTYESGEIVADERGSHFTVNEQQYNWSKVPFVAFKYNDIEQPLVSMIKSLVDDFNSQASVNSDILKDLPDLIYILKGYGGQDLADFITNLKNYRVIETAAEEGNTVDKIQTTPDTTAVENTLERLRRNIIEFGRGVDFANLNIGNATGVGLRFRYSDLDMDCNMLETEFQASFEQLLWFIKVYFNMAGLGNFKEYKSNITFNRDIIINERDVIEMCKNSVSLVSIETILENHPWVNDVIAELKRIEKEREADPYYESMSKANE